MFSGLYGRPFSRLNLSAIACFSSGIEGVGVYLVWPLSSAAFAASLMNVGVSKSGSPAPKPTTSTPAFFSAFALALTARVIDSETRLIRSARGNIARAFLVWVNGRETVWPSGRGFKITRGDGHFRRSVGTRDWGSCCAMSPRRFRCSVLLVL